MDRNSNSEMGRRGEAARRSRVLQLARSFILSQFGSAKSKARASYIRFVQDGLDDKPWDMLNGPDIRGDDYFRSEMQSGFDIDISKRKQLLRHIPLAAIATENRDRGEWMREAYCEHGYTMQAIAEFAGLHHSTVSLLIKGYDNNSQFKAPFPF